MSAQTRDAATPSGKAVWTGRVIACLLVAYLLFGAVVSVMRVPFAVEGTLQFGYPEGAVVGIGLALLVSTVLYAIPRTAVLGATLLTGYLGGAVATHVRLEDGAVPLPVAFGVLVWLSLYLRDARLRTFLPLRRREARKDDEPTGRNAAVEVPWGEQPSKPPHPPRPHRRTS